MGYGFEPPYVEERLAAASAVPTARWSDKGTKNEEEERRRMIRVCLDRWTKRMFGFSELNFSLITWDV
jgi:hypothetical protein